jgi:ABC-type transport system involved in cytochrome c biogenesis permease subunit
MNRFILIIISVISLTLPALAENSFDYELVKKIPIQAEGRIKPLDSYAKYLLISLSGKSKLDSDSHIEWFTKLIFNPESSANKKIFLINNPELLEALGLESDHSRRYSFKELEPGIDKLFELAAQALQKNEEDRVEIEKEFIRVFKNINSYIQLSNSFLFNFKHPDFTVSDLTKSELNLKSNFNSLFDVIIKADPIAKTLETQNTSSLMNKEIIRLAFLIYDWVEKYKNYQELYIVNTSMDLIPINEHKLVSAWDQLIDPDIELTEEIHILSKLHNAFLENNHQGFNNLTKEYLKLVNSKTKLKNKIELEVFYNKLNPIFNSKILYGLALILVLLCAIIQYPPLKLCSVIFSCIGFLLHTSALLLRILILDRAPVSNLFETFIFVSWIIVLLGLLLNFFDKNSKLGIFLASFSGLILLLISGKFAVEADTMQVLIAVLNSNFWLSTHVIAVTVGYAGVFSAGIVAHVYLIKQIINKNAHNKKLTGIFLGLLNFGLCFSFLGTLLGGIWADQSWGRFWGWDPKENGALLIVLWSTLVFHARLSGMVKDTGLALLTAFASVVVITSWFGVNLLGVGLHSYGFTSGIATGLFSYYFLELIFFAGFFLLDRKNSQ